MKILAAIPIDYCDDNVFWRRDLGLVVRALREQGHEAYFVALGALQDSTEKPLKVIPRTTMADPKWWQLQKPDGIILNAWSATRYHDIRSAALSARCPVIEKLDTDGVKTPRMFFWGYFFSDLLQYDRRFPIRQGAKALVKTILRSLVVYCLPSVLDRRIIRSISPVPILAAETPVAAARVRRFLRMYDARPMPSVVMIPHPVDTSNHRFSGGGVKNNQVIAIARWDVAFKGWPLLKRIAQRFLRIHGDWKLIVAGVGAEKEGAALAAEFEGRFEMLGFLEHARLSDHLRASKIYLLTSYVESFNIAGAEALCCGCSVVGPGQIPSSAFFAGMASGTPSHRRNADELLDALSAEVGEWESGSRDPVAIAEHWKERVSAESVARRFAELFQPAVSGMGIPAQPQKSAGQE